MDVPETPEGEWQACPAGGFDGMLTAVRRQRRNQFLMRAGGIATILLAAGLLPILLSSDGSETVAGTNSASTPGSGDVESPELCGVTCQEVQKSARAWLAGEVPAQKSEQIEAHLKECPHCPQFVDQIRIEADQSRIAGPQSFLIAASR